MEAQLREDHPGQCLLLRRQAGSSTTVNWNEDSYDAQISGDGKTVVFRSGADNLVAGDTNGISDIFLHSLTNHRTIRISVGPQGQQATPTGTSSEGADFPSISADGKTVAYNGYQLKGIVAEDTGDNYQIYVYDRTTGRTAGGQVAAGELVNDTLSAPTLSPDGASSVSRPAPREWSRRTPTA